MKKKLYTSRFLSALIIALSAHTVAYAAAVKGINAGKVLFFNNATTAFDTYVQDPSIVQKKWINNRYPRMLTYSPSFDSKNTWYHGGLAYIDSYAIYANDSLADAHPEWIMRDSYGNKLYIPWSCNGGECSQFAGDFSNAAFRRYMVQKIKSTVAKGYKGVWLDDVNLTWRVGNTNDVNSFVVPIDSNTGRPMTLSKWQNYFAQYLKEIRAALPQQEIAHNALWYATSVKSINSAIISQIKSANYINLERGGNDEGLVKGTGEWGYETFLKYIDAVHKQGTSVILMDIATTPTQREFGLATSLLVNQGKDLINNNQLSWTTPNGWWKGYSLNLGDALNDRYNWHNMIRRDFTCGSVLLNQPDMPTLSAAVGSGYKNLDNYVANSITLEARTAAILTTSCNSARKVPTRRFLP